MIEKTNELNDITITKEDVIEALDGSHTLTPKTIKVLKALVCCSVDNIVRMSVVDLGKVSKVGRQGCYPAINQLKREGYITKDIEIGGKVSKFFINPNKLKELVRNYRALKFGEAILNNSKQNQNHS